MKGAMPAIQMYQAGMDNIDQDVASREDAYRQALIGARTGDMRMQAAREAAGLETKQRLAVAEFDLKAKLAELEAKGMATYDNLLKMFMEAQEPNQSTMTPLMATPAGMTPAEYAHQQATQALARQRFAKPLDTTKQ
jgi:hypothetical protein